MKNLLTVILIFASTLYANAQCTQIIPPSPGHTKITSSGTLNAVGQTYWVCEGVTLDILSSAGAVFYLEKGATLNIINSTGDAVFAKDNSTINNKSNAGINLTANLSNVVYNNTGSGTIVPINCSVLTFTYTFVGGSPCKASGLGVNKISQSRMTIFPNPVNEGSSVNLKGNSGEVSIEVYDLSGRKVFEKANVGTSFRAKSLKKGHYFILITDGEELSRTTLVIN